MQITALSLFFTHRRLLFNVCKKHVTHNCKWNSLPTYIMQFLKREVRCHMTIVPKDEILQI